MTDLPLLSIVICIPIVGSAALLLLLRGEGKQSSLNARWGALITTCVTFGFSLGLVFGFDPQQPGFQFTEEADWLLGFNYRLGVDGVSLPFVFLTTFLMPIVIGASWSLDFRVKEYMVAFLTLESLMIGVFSSLDLVLFYLFFESGLIPMFLIIGIWGGGKRVYAAFKFFLYTLLGSILMLIAMIGMVYDAGTTDISRLLVHKFSSETMDVLGWQVGGGFQTLLWLAFFASFAVKIPMWPFHTWLPDAHVQAPTAGSVVLAAVLLKMGGYGFLRFNFPMFPIASVIMQDFIFILSVTAIIYTSLVALVQVDIKKLIAYSSVAHMGFVTLGIFSANRQGIDGAMFQMISHGFISGAMFLCVGVLYDRMHTREIGAYGGLAVRMPVFAFFFMLFTMGNIGLPGTSGFVGEFLALAGAFQVSTWAAIGAGFGVVLSAAYGLWLYRRVVFGDLVKESLANIPDLDAREKAIFVPLVVATLVLGIYPKLVTDMVGPSVAALVASHERALADAATSLTEN